MDSKKLALLCRDYADNKKAEDILVLDMRKVSSVTDFFVIVSGSSQPHLRAIAEEITEKLKEKQNLAPRAQEGSPTSSSWIVLDYFGLSDRVTSSVMALRRSEMPARLRLTGAVVEYPLSRSGSR